MFKIFSLILVFFSLAFGNFKEQLKDFDSNFINASNDMQIKLHQQLKALYIQSVIQEDAAGKIEILKRLLISANTLGFDDKSYIQELKESGVSGGGIEALKRAVIKDYPQKSAEKSVFTPSSQNQITSSKIYILSHKKLAKGIELQLNGVLNLKEIKDFKLSEKGNYRYIIDFDAVLEGGRRDYHFDDFSIVLSQYDPKTVRVVVRSKEKIEVNFKQENTLFSIFAQDLKTLSKTPPNTQKNKEEKPLYILKIDKTKGGIVLNFNEKLDEKKLSFLSTKDTQFRHIISLEGILEGNRQNFIFEQGSITVTQYNPKIVRIVLSAPQSFTLLKKLDGQSLTLAFNDSTPHPKTISEKTSSSPQGKKNKIIVIDAGHGGQDSGALSDKKGSLKEKEVVLSTALKLGEELKKRGYKIFYTRSTDKFINLRDRTKIANDKRADLFLSIHANAAPHASKNNSSEGLETFFLSPARSERSKKAAEKENQGDFEDINHFSKQSILNFLNREKIISSNKLAIDIHRGVLGKTRSRYKIVDGGVREAPFWVLVGASMPAILLEIGYITHPSEGKRIASKSFQDLLAKGIADGVDNYFYHNP